MLISRYKLYLYIFLAVFWLAAAWGFVADELIPPLHNLDTVKLLIVDGVLAILGLACLRNRFDITVVGSFLLLSFFSSFVFNNVGLAIYFNGFRDFVGLLFVVPVLRYFFTSSNAAEFKKTFDRNLLIWLWLQAFCVTWQYLRYGAGDMGGGTYGEGGSGMVSMMIYVVSFYLIAPRWDSSRYWQSLRENKWYIILLYPTFLNETKVSFILILAYFVLLIKFDRNLILRLTYIVPLGLVVLSGLFVAYVNITEQDAEDFFKLETYQEYLYGLDLDELIDIAYKVQDGYYDMSEVGIWSQDIPRFAKIGLSIPIIAVEKGGILFGAGIGQFKGWTTGLCTTFSVDNRWLLIGSRPELFVIFVQLGLLGIVWLLWVLIKICFSGTSNYSMGKQIRVFISICLLIIMVYNDNLREVVLCATFFYILMAIKFAPELDKNTSNDLKL